MNPSNANALSNLGILAINSGDDEQAVRLFRSALALDPELARAYIGVGVAYAHTGDYAQVVAPFRKAIRLDGPALRSVIVTTVISSLPTRHGTGYANLTGEIAEILRRMDEAEALLHLAASHLRRGYDEGAVRSLERSLSLSPDCWQAIMMLIAAYLLLGAGDTTAMVDASRGSVLSNVAPAVIDVLFTE